jgi:hypothetical protein
MSSATCSTTNRDPESGPPVFGIFAVPGEGGLVFGAVRSDVARVSVEGDNGSVDETATTRAFGVRFFAADLGGKRFMRSPVPRSTRIAEYWTMPSLP